MTTSAIALIFAFTSVGILLMAYVQMSVIRAEGFDVFRQKRFSAVYWHERSALQRWYFFLGLAFAVLPWIFAAVGAIAHVA